MDGWDDVVLIPAGPRSIGLSPNDQGAAIGRRCMMMPLDSVAVDDSRSLAPQDAAFVTEQPARSSPMTNKQEWARRVYERHLDLLLAEELSCNDEFARWFMKRAVLIREVPDGLPLETVVEVSHDDSIGIDAGASGENDLFVSAVWPNGKIVRILIEDKLDAVVQPRQFERYLERVKAHAAEPDVAAAGAVAVAPAAYLERHSDQLGILKRISIEEIATELEAAAARLGETSGDAGLAARLRWRSQRLVRLDEGRRSAAIDHSPTIEVRDYIIDRLTDVPADCEPQESSMHTAHQGWLYFRSPKALLYKVAHGTVDVYLRDIWPHDEARQSTVHASGAGPAGFVATEDTKGNLVFAKRLRCDEAPRWRIAEQDQLGRERLDELDAGVQACAEAIDWIRGLEVSDKIRGSQDCS